MFLRFRNISAGKVILALIAVIIFIQVWHMNMLIKQESDQTESIAPVQTNRKMVEEVEELVSKIENAHVLDSSGTYHVMTDIFGKKRSDKVNVNDITLVSQTSSNHLDDLVDLTRRWDGSISIAVFTHKNDFEFALRNLMHFNFCFPRIKNQVYFHLIFPLNSVPSFEDLNRFSDFKIDCSTLMPKHERLNYDIEGVEYPHNLLRNTAVKFCKTKFILLIDIDMIPNENLRADFMKFDADQKLSQNDSILFVVPSFEFVNKNYTELPPDRSKLLQQWRLEKIRPFYYDVCWKCQRPTDYDKWTFLPEKDSLDVSYFLEWQDPWEPFYIAQNKFPLYDERFKQYGFNRISQVCEMNIAGYKFGVLNNAFLVHKGFKFPNTFHKTKEMENNRNRDLYRQFKRELKTKYPNSDRSC